MIRKLLVVMVLVLALMLPSMSTAQGPNDVVVFLFFPEPEYTLLPGGNVDFFYGWGVCRAPGLLQSFQTTFEAYIELNGVVLVDGTVKDSRQYWEPMFEDVENPFCNNHPDPNYVAFWWNPVDPGLPPGDYDLHVVVSFRHPVTDLFDYFYQLPDGTVVEPNGIPDHYPAGTYFDWTATLHVLP